MHSLWLELSTGEAEPQARQDLHLMWQPEAGPDPDSRAKVSPFQVAKVPDRYLILHVAGEYVS